MTDESAAPRGRGSRSEPKPQSDASHDDTLIDWFLSLSPEERLAELESRIAFFNSVAPDGGSKLSTNS